jgi:hypothetical protein
VKRILYLAVSVAAPLLTMSLSTAALGYSLSFWMSAYAPANLTSPDGGTQRHRQPEAA